MAKPSSRQIVHAALSHQPTERTPLFELFQSFHPIHWKICGRTVATDMAMAWDAMADGIAWEELAEAEIKAEYAVRKFFGLNMVRLNGAPSRNFARPVKTGKNKWKLNGTAYHLNERIFMVEPENPTEAMSDSKKISENETRLMIEKWDGNEPAESGEIDPVLRGVQSLAQRDGLDWVYMAEIGAGTGVAFYPPFMLMWLIDEPDLLRRWIDMHKTAAFAATKLAIRAGCSVVAIGGDVSCDKGPFISPAHYHEFILPVIQEHVKLIHSLGAKAVYTSDGNHWPIKKDFFFNSGIDGYKEVDKAAGMTWPRMLEEGVADRVCIIGNIDARHTLCLGTPSEVRAEVRECLDYGRRAKGGHILHASHSVHEDVKADNYFAVVNAYREYFEMEPLPN
ncbi:MAG: uroporphyrinogen decarboxylase family protein [Kiritimatiellae bacterium]|nr:uroporphyrinogen decarboxylase family protein [Verrucomicrobiota bacterium]MCG2660589.1 uroporphyrinogen decarboxylase family protein [Kiritimatiellia bacterium]